MKNPVKELKKISKHRMGFIEEIIKEYNLPSQGIYATFRVMEDAQNYWIKVLTEKDPDT